MLKFDFKNETQIKADKKIFQNILKRGEKVLKEKIDECLGKKRGQISLALIDVPVIWAMNMEYRKKDAPTDVISFAYLEVADAKKQKGDFIVGDMFICPQVAQIQADEHKHSLEKELEILFTHGFLHLFGFDHKTDEEEEEMEKWAKKILV